MCPDDIFLVLMVHVDMLVADNTAVKLTDWPAASGSW